MFFSLLLNVSLPDTFAADRQPCFLELSGEKVYIKKKVAIG